MADFSRGLSMDFAMDAPEPQHINFGVCPISLGEQGEKGHAHHSSGKGCIHHRVHRTLKDRCFYTVVMSTVFLPWGVA